MQIEKIVGMSGISIDTRTLLPGNIFIALKGVHFDGHDFIERAFKKGASLAIVNAGTFLKMPSLSGLMIEVKDTTLALGALAKSHRIDFQGPVFGITGSNGKTTVKSMLGSIFSEFTTPLVTQGNLNNHLGVPLTLLKLQKEHSTAIVEMGANQPGDIRYLCELAKPTITLVNNVMKAHLAGFGSLEGVAHTKGEIYESLEISGIAVLNVDIDLPFLNYFKTLIGKRKCITFGLNSSEHPNITAQDIELNEAFSRFTLVTPRGELKVHCPVIGHHNVLNALAASSLAFAAGVSLDNIAKGLAHFSPVQGRLQSIQTPLGACVIDDSYNANPGSFEAAMNVLAAASGLKILVMGDMGELGDTAAFLHDQIGSCAREKGIDRLLAVGHLSENSVKAFGNGAQFYNTKEALIADLVKLLSPKATCLIKGSRSAQMETVVQALLEGYTHHQTIGEF